MTWMVLTYILVGLGFWLAWVWRNHYATLDDLLVIPLAICSWPISAVVALIPWRTREALKNRVIWRRK